MTSLWPSAGFPEETRLKIVEAMESWVPRRPIPEGAFVGSSFPYPHQIFNEVTTDQDLLDFIALALDSEDIHMRLAHNWVRFPGNTPQGIENEAVVRKYKHGGGVEGTTRQRFGGFHVDNGNNSLVPPTHDRRLGQISSWYFPEAVDETQAPMLVVPKHKMPADSKVQPDKSDAIALCVPANTLMIFVRPKRPSCHARASPARLTQRRCVSEHGALAQCEYVPGRSRATLHPDEDLWPGRPPVGGRRQFHERGWEPTLAHVHLGSERSAAPVLSLPSTGA